MIRILFNTICLIGVLSACSQSQSVQSVINTTVEDVVTIVDYPAPGAQQFNRYVPGLEGKNVGLVVNKASEINGTHLVDVLMSKSVNVKAIFAPEHGFRGDADAGEKIDSAVDEKTGLPIYSLYGKNKKPSRTQFDNLDVVVFDLQDVGVRFYTYLSTLHYVMEAAAESNLPVIVLDRPNPNGFYTAGPILDTKYESFVGLHPVPIVTGMTIGEYGQMINGEGWLANGVQCDLSVVSCPTYNHHQTFELPIAPSPNLPNHRAVLLYPSLCLFEGTTISVGRGTTKPFQQIGHPKLTQYEDSFVPKSGYGSKSPKHENIFCFGKDLTRLSMQEIIDEQLDFTYLWEFSRSTKAVNAKYFNDNNFFEKLAGSEVIRNGISAGTDLNAVAADWADELNKFMDTRSKYLLYK